MDMGNTASDRSAEIMAAGNVQAIKAPVCVLPDAQIQRFLLDVIDNTPFKGDIVESVAAIKHVLRTAQISG